MRRSPVLIYFASVLAFIAVWWLASLTTLPVFIPSPALTLQSAIELAQSGDLQTAIGISFFRIMSGWLLGAVVGAPLGLLMGRLPIVRQIATPYVEFFRFVPPIAFVTLFLIWFGTGEQSKILLIFYTSVFIVVVNTMSGVLSIKSNSVRAALCLGATNRQIMWRVILPETVPYIVTGMRLAMGNSFMTIVAAEMLAASSGIGFIIWTSRGFMLTDQIFVALITLGLMGFISDWIFRVIAARLLSRYRVYR
jgi:NitT/TauT family transport system permease protein